jgi:RNA recognition motif-containing protein
VGGKMVKADMMKDIKTGQLKGDALITFAIAKSAMDGLSENGQEFEERLVKVSIVLR